MRRLIVMAATVAALVVAVVIGPMGTAAAGPYVFGCTPLNWQGFAGNPRAALTIYNGSAATANLTHKVLSGNGRRGMASLSRNSSQSSADPASRTSPARWLRRSP